MSEISKQPEPRELTYNPPKGIINLDKASNYLLEMIEEVKKDPTKIPQAECMATIAGRVCDMAKVQVEQGKVVLAMIETKKDVIPL